MNIVSAIAPTTGAFAVLPLNLGDSVTFLRNGSTSTVTEVGKAIGGTPHYQFSDGKPAAHAFIEDATAEGRATITRKPGSLAESAFGLGGDWAKALATQGLAEEKAQREASAAAFDQEEDEAGLIEMLAQEEESRAGYGFLCTYGPGCDF